MTHPHNAGVDSGEDVTLDSELNSGQEHVPADRKCAPKMLRSVLICAPINASDHRDILPSCAACSRRWDWTRSLLRAEGAASLWSLTPRSQARSSRQPL